MNLVLYGLYVVSVILQVLLIVLLLRNSLRQYRLFLSYCVIQLVLIFSQSFVLYTAGPTSSQYRNVYWSSEVIAYFLLFIMVILMTDRVLQGNPFRPKATKILFVITIVATLLPFVLYGNYFTSRWYRQTCQLLSLSGAIMNLVLWTGMLTQRRKDAQLMKVSAGLGLGVTGIAIAYGVRPFLPADWHWLTDVFKSVVLTGMLAIWCWAFWRTAPQTATSGQPLAGNTHAL
ncbi:MAG: hypothetical protein ABL995_18460 [Bryobacteraceae bacterium]